jgi:cytoskeletal protein CcmA (bactofilin family)
LGKGVDFKGIVRFDGTVRVDGHVEGEIHTTGTLIVGEHAVIKGIVSAGVLMNSGKINGTITAIEKIHILKPGVLVGDIRTPLIAIEEGSHFHGMCDMGADHWSDERTLAVDVPHGLVASAH